MFSHPDPEVLVVGAGPVGLVAALFLEQYGVGVKIVDTHQRTTQHSYALAIHPRTLRILEEAGLADALIDAGRKLTKVASTKGGRGAPKKARKNLKGPLGTPASGPRCRRRDPPGRSRYARPGRERLSGARTEWVVVRSETIRPAYVIGADEDRVRPCGG